MHNLYPAIKAYAQHNLQVGPIHKLYVEETGNPQGIPVVILHAGPGMGSDPYLRRFFDPQLFRMISFDQRGCGRSTPHLELRENTTTDLLNDITAIKEFLKLDAFILFGGGFGSMLALLYAQSNPRAVRGLVLYQVFLGRQQDINWFYKQGANLVYPDYWQEFTQIVPKEHLNDIPNYYASCMQGTNELARMSAAKNWALWQARCNSLQPHLSVIDQFSDPHFASTLATLETYYLTNHLFIKENQIMDNISLIKHLPTYLVHGRYDLITPLAIAWEVHQAIPGSNLRIVRDAGHSDRESGIIDAIVYASKDISKQGLDAS